MLSADNVKSAKPARKTTVIKLSIEILVDKSIFYCVSTL
jgi:hypothetical protein